MMTENEIYQENMISEDWRKKDTERLMDKLNIDKAEVEEISARIKQGESISFNSTGEACKVLTALGQARATKIQQNPIIKQKCENLKRIVEEMKQ